MDSVSDENLLVVDDTNSNLLDVIGDQQQTSDSGADDDILDVCAPVVQQSFSTRAQMTDAISAYCE